MAQAAGVKGAGAQGSAGHRRDGDPGSGEGGGHDMRSLYRHSSYGPQGLRGSSPALLI
jgi:hypothetical protein